MPLAAVAVVAVLAGCGGDDVRGSGDATPAASSALPPLATEPGNGPSGFGTVLARITAADGTVCERCMWLAENQDDRARGLMGVTDLGGLDGMVFRYDEPGRRSFWMKDTLLPLSIAFVGADGGLVGVADMAPCVADPCPSYGPDEPFQVAIEVAQGRLGELGLGDGSVVELRGDCDPTTSDQTGA